MFLDRYLHIHNYSFREEPIESLTKIKVLLDAGADPNLGRSVRGMAPLQQLVSLSWGSDHDVTLLRMLVEKGTNPYIKDGKGQNLLHLAALNREKNEGYKGAGLPLIKALKDMGINLNETDKKGYLPAILTIQQQQEDLAILEEIFRGAYAGYYVHKKQGIDLIERIKKIKVASVNKVNTFLEILRNLHKGTLDNHISYHLFHINKQSNEEKTSHEKFSFYKTKNEIYVRIPFFEEYDPKDVQTNRAKFLEILKVSDSNVVFDLRGNRGG